MPYDQSKKTFADKNGYQDRVQYEKSWAREDTVSGRDYLLMAFMEVELHSARQAITRLRTHGVIDLIARDVSRLFRLEWVP